MDGNPNNEDRRRHTSEDKIWICYARIKVYNKKSYRLTDELRQHIKSEETPRGRDQSIKHVEGVTLNRPLKEY